MGTDGKFGPGTAAIVKIMKSGYGLENPSSPDITNALYAELKKDETIKESRILSFDAYSGISEAFDTGAATKSASSQPAAKKSAPSAKKQTGKAKSKLLYKKGDTGNVIIAINRIIGPYTPDEKNYTDNTVSRVKDFQKLNGIYVDGTSGEDTLTALYNTRPNATEKAKLNDEKARPGEWPYKTLAELLGLTYVPGPNVPTVKTYTDEDLLGETSGLSSFINTILPAAKYAAFIGLPIGGALVATTIDALKDRRTGVKGVVDALDGYVKEVDLSYVLTICKALKGAKMKDGTSALERFKELYRLDENGDTLLGDVKGVGTATFSVKGDLVKAELIKLLGG